MRESEAEGPLHFMSDCKKSQEVKNGLISYIVWQFNITDLQFPELN